MIQIWQPTRATGRCMIASWSKWLLRLSFIPWIHTLSEPRRLKNDLNPRLSFNLIKTMPTLRSPWSYRCRLRAKAPASGFHSISCTCNSEQFFLRLSWDFNWSLLSDTHILNLGWRIGILLFFHPASAELLTFNLEFDQLEPFSQLIQISDKYL